MKNFPFLIAVALTLAACSSTKYVPDGSYLMDAVEVTCLDDTADINVSELRSYLRQQSNSQWFSSLKIPLLTYSLSGRDSTRWINRILKRMGEPPILYDSARTAKSCATLIAKLQADGFLDAEVETSVDSTRKRKKAIVTYSITPHEPYRIATLRYNIRDSVISALLDKQHFTPALCPGDRLDMAALDAERSRITTALSNVGYYRFNKDFITYTADTLHGSTDVDLTLTLHPYVTRNTPDTLHTRYIIRSINYRSGDVNDSTIHLRQKVLERNTFITPGTYYSAKDLRRTYNHFGRLGAIKYTDITFKSVGDDSLDCTIALGAAKPMTITFQPEGTNTAGDLGAAATLTFTSRNVFRGSESVSIQFRGAYESIHGLEGYANEDFIEYGAEARLLFPRFIAPFLSTKVRRRVTATSEVAVAYNLQDRPEYQRRVLSAAWRYKWSDANHHDTYQLDLLDLNYVSMPWISDKFRQDYLENTSSRNAILMYNYEDLFIMKLGFAYTYNNGAHAIKVAVETAGNTLWGISHATGEKRNSSGNYEAFGIAYAQYAKVDFDYTKNWRLDYASTLVFHFAFGIAYPYGNSTILPFEKRYFSGGANSVRGWGVRELGPGRYKEADGNINFINQTGDMKLDFNIEYRAHLFWKLAGALFIDAGNIWTLRYYEDQDGGQFHFRDFAEQIAVAYGAGLRLHFDYFILRFDFGMKAVNPAYTSSRYHYPIIHPRLRRDFTFHFAVGMPF